MQLPDHSGSWVMDPRGSGMMNQDSISSHITSSTWGVSLPTTNSSSNNTSNSNNSGPNNNSGEGLNNTMRRKPGGPAQHSNQSAPSQPDPRVSILDTTQRGGFPAADMYLPASNNALSHNMHGPGLSLPLSAGFSEPGAGGTHGDRRGGQGRSVDAILPNDLENVNLRRSQRPSSPGGRSAGLVPAAGKGKGKGQARIRLDGRGAGGGGVDLSGNVNHQQQHGRAGQYGGGDGGAGGGLGQLSEQDLSYQVGGEVSRSGLCRVAQHDLDTVFEGIS